MPYVPEDDLDEHRRAPEEPDVDPRRAGQQPAGRQPHDGQDDAEDDAHRHGDGRELQGDDDAPEHGRGEQVLADHAPLEAALPHPAPGDVGEDQGVDQHGPEHAG